MRAGLSCSAWRTGADPCAFEPKQLTGAVPVELAAPWLAAAAAEGAEPSGPAAAAAAAACAAAAATLSSLSSTAEVECTMTRAGQQACRKATHLARLSSMSPRSVSSITKRVSVRKRRSLLNSYVSMDASPRLNQPLPTS
jgi:hypothetical protein